MNFPPQLSQDRDRYREMEDDICRRERTFFKLWGNVLANKEKSVCCCERTAPLSQKGQAAATSTGAYIRHCSQAWGPSAQFPATIQGVSVPGEWNPAFVWLPQSLLCWDVPCNRNPDTLIIQKPGRGRGRRLVGAKGSGRNWICKNFLLAKAAQCPKVSRDSTVSEDGRECLRKTIQLP